MTHNIQAISFLIGSFRELVKSFGANNKTVAYFRSNVTGLINIGQIQGADAQLVYKLIGMENTDNVKWEISNNKVDMYIHTVDNLLRYPDLSKDMVIAILAMLLNQDQITAEIEQLVKETFGIKGNRMKEASKKGSGFGSLSFKSDNTLTDISLLRKHSNMIIRVKNSQAVCSCDTSYYSPSVQDILTGNTRAQRAIEELVKGSAYSVGTMEYSSDSCSHSSVFKSNPNLTKLFKENIDWKKVYDAYTIQRADL